MFHSHSLTFPKVFFTTRCTITMAIALSRQHQDSLLYFLLLFFQLLLFVGTTISILKLCGRVYVLVSGTFLTYTELAASCTILPIVFLVLYAFMPESPYYLVQSGKLDQAFGSLKRLSCSTDNDAVIENRIAEIKRTVEYDMQSKTTFWELISKKDHRKGLVAVIGKELVSSGRNEKFFFNCMVMFLKATVEIKTRKRLLRHHVCYKLLKKKQVLSVQKQNSSELVCLIFTFENPVKNTFCLKLSTNFNSDI